MGKQIFVWALIGIISAGLLFSSIALFAEEKNSSKNESSSSEEETKKDKDKKTEEDAGSKTKEDEGSKSKEGDDLKNVEPAEAEAVTKKEDIIRVLKTQKITFAFEETDLQDVLNYLNNLTGINFQLDRKVYEKMDDADRKVTIRVKNLPLKNLLILILEQRGLTVVYKYGMLFVTSVEEVEKNTFLKVYDIRDLMTPVRDFPGPEISLTPPGEENQMGGSFSLDASEPREVFPPDLLIDIIKNNTGGTSWNDNPNVSIAMHGGLLLVTQSARVHAEIADLLGKLRQFK